MPAVSQSEFARQIGVDRSHITRLKQAGRLVMTADGRVDADASRARIAETADPNRDDVAARHAAAKVSPGGTAPPPAAPDQTDKVGNSYQAARAVKEKYLALDAKATYEQRIGELIPRAEVQSALDDLVAFARAGIENLPHRVAGLLVGKDYDAILATLRQEVVGLMADMHKDAGRKLAELTEGPG